jgi:TolB protein
LENPNVGKIPIAIPDFISPDPGAVSGRDFAQIIRNDLHLTGMFQIVSPNIAWNGGDPDFDAWAKAGSAALITGVYQVVGNEISLEARLYDTALKKAEIGKRITGKISDHRKIAHRFADRVMEKLTGAPGCFSSRIAFVGEIPERELFAMDFDGFNPAQLTRNASIILSPEWTPDGKSLLFTSYLNHNPDLWRLNLDDLRQHPVSARPGINASARYSPVNDIIALSLSFNGTPKIFLVTPRGEIIKRLTDGRGNDISPTWSPDGSHLAFVSDHAGSPQIYIIPVNGGQPRRVTSAGKYNTDPDWSPRGDLLAFTSRIDGRFQICSIKTDGTEFKVLTSEGANQDPAWSPDGRMIAFTSDRAGRKLIYLMDAKGTIQTPISRVPGKAPAWSKNLP